MVDNIVIENMTTGVQIELDTITTQDYVMGSVDWGEVQSTHHTYKYVNQIGTQVVGTTLESRPISIIGWIIADSDIVMTERKAKLNAFVNPQQPIKLYYKGLTGYTLQFFPLTSIKYGKTNLDNNEVLTKFIIDGDCYSPLFTEALDNLVAAANTIGMFHFPLIISKDPDPPGGIVFGTRQTSLFMIVTNRGSVSVGMTIVLRAKGVVTNPSIIDVNTQQEFKLQVNMQSGQEITIDTNIGQKTVTSMLNGSRENYFKYKDIDSPWLQLAIGDNILRPSADSGLENLEVYITFNNAFLEVQECY